MDPGALGPFEWAEIDKLLQNLWLVVLFVIIFAGNMIVGHNLIPSFVASEHISRAWQKARVVFYALAIISIILATFFLIQVIILAQVLRSFWENFWI